MRIRSVAFDAKSTEQVGVSEDQKSVARQVEHARAYAATKGWTVADEHVYGRESIETAYALEQLISAGVRVFFYLEDRERTLDSPIEKIMLSLTTFADELEREKARQRTYDAMLRKAKAGHVTGGRCFGDRNVDVVDASGNRSHVERQIEDQEAAVIRRIFALSVDGHGVKAIAKMLNDEGERGVRGVRVSNLWVTRAVARLECHLWRISSTYRGVPNGIRTRVLALKGPRPRPLDDGDSRTGTQNDTTTGRATPHLPFDLTRRDSAHNHGNRYTDLETALTDAERRRHGC